jgi:ribosomal-protein-alanine N-acetyltransferase
LPNVGLIHTPRLRMEPLEETHAIDLFDGLRDEALYEFIGEQPPESVETLRERYRRLASRTSPDGEEAWLNWALRSLSTGSCIGWTQATIHPDRSAHVAYVLFREAWGLGYAREAVTAMIAHLRDPWSVTRVRATVDTRNRRSLALLEALGFRRGLVRFGAEIIRGELTDEIEYELRVG